MELKDSKTRTNLMRAYAGESQARNRYDYAAYIAQKEGYGAISKVFEYTANQEKAHAAVFLSFLKASNGEAITLDTAYPVNAYTTTLEHLTAAKENEYNEWENVYTDFAEIAREEGFDVIAMAFENIALVEKDHGDRFSYYKEAIEKGTLYIKEENQIWMCTNCGYIITSDTVPEVCPVCSKSKGYFNKANDKISILL